MQELDQGGVDLSGVKHVKDIPTAVAAVLVEDASGENQICVGIGANASVHVDQLTDAILEDTSVLILQVREKPNNPLRIPLMSFSL
eukprot:7299853-Pyramimonas_sp.AAC.2